MNWLWISGWAVPPAWLEAQAQAVWPEERHRCVAPTDAAEALCAQNFDAMGGYSLGALWLLRHVKDIPQKMPVILLAPIFAFTAEQSRGGRVALTQLRLQRRRLRSQPTAAVADFFQYAGLSELETSPQTAAWNAPRAAALDEELGWLEDWQAPAPSSENWHGFAGDNDPLLDATILKKIWPALQIVANAGHAPRPLLQAARESFLEKSQ